MNAFIYKVSLSVRPSEIDRFSFTIRFLECATVSGSTHSNGVGQAVTQLPLSITALSLAGAAMAVEVQQAEWIQQTLER